MRNPPWSRDELILALDFYKKYDPSIPGKHSQEIADLSILLNCLSSALGGEREATFRNPNGVYMKLMNFRRFDPGYEGKGLERGNKDEEVVWKLYAHNETELNKAAVSIRSFVASESVDTEAAMPVPQGVDEADEGRILTRVHTSRERNPKLVERKKGKFLKENGKLFCEACGFDFEAAYGDRGTGFIECHHTKPVSELRPGERTKVDDLVLLCSNCHRMVHRKRPWLNMNKLMKLIRSSGVKRVD